MLGICQIDDGNENRGDFSVVVDNLLSLGSVDDDNVLESGGRVKRRL